MKRILLGIYCLIFLVGAINAKSFTYEQDDLDVIFVVDYSNSMNANDENKVALDMIGAFIDTTFSSKSRVGFVGYNHTIIDSSKPQDITTKGAREQLKGRIKKIRRSGSTDIGLALKQALTLLEDKPSRNQVIILLSDGESDLTYANNGRTLQNCEKDIKEVVSTCSQKGIPIHTIAFGDYAGDSSSLGEIAKETHGNNSRVTMPSDLIEIFNSITKEKYNSSIIPIATSISGGEVQSLDIPITTAYIKEANLLVVSSEAIKDASVYYKGAEVALSQSPYYFTIKIDKPKEGNIKIQYRGKKGQTIKAYLLLYQDQPLKIEIKEPIYKNQPINVQAYYWDQEKEKPILNSDFYKGFSGNISVSPEGGETLINADLKEKEGVLGASFTLSASGDYSMNYLMEATAYLLKVGNLKFKCENTIPTGKLKIKEITCKAQEANTYNLTDYYKDVDGDALSYSIKHQKGNSVACELEGNQLTLCNKHVGESAIELVVSDGETEVIQKLQVNVLPIWKYYLKVTMMIIVALVAVIVAFIWRYVKIVKARPKPAFSGKLNIYFVKTPEGEEIEPLVFPLYHLYPKKITLQNLLDEVEIKLDELRTDKIYIEPGTERTLVVSHYTKNSMMIGTSIICRNLKYTISYGDRIYLTSEDDTYEIEIHFMPCKETSQVKASATYSV